MKSKAETTGFIVNEFYDEFCRSCNRVQDGLWKPLSLLKDILHQNSQHSSTHLCAVESELCSICKGKMKLALCFRHYLNIHLKLTINVEKGLLQRSKSLFFVTPFDSAQTVILYHSINKSNFYEMLLFIYACIEAILKMQLMICIIGATQKMALYYILLFDEGLMFIKSKWTL